jgi:hypothetical protein
MGFWLQCRIYYDDYWQDRPESSDTLALNFKAAWNLAQADVSLFLERNYPVLKSLKIRTRRMRLKSIVVVFEYLMYFRLIILTAQSEKSLFNGTVHRHRFR